MMRSVKMAAVAAMLLVSMAVPALGAVVINATDTGSSFTIDYTGLVGGSVTPSVSALGTYTFAGVTNGGKTYNFNYSINNDSTTTARLSGFAFNTSPNPTSATVTGAFTRPTAAITLRVTDRSTSASPRPAVPARAVVAAVITKATRAPGPSR